MGITNPTGGIIMDKTERESRILRERRLELGLSQTEVAINAGLQLQHYALLSERRNTANFM